VEFAVEDQYFEQMLVNKKTYEANRFLKTFLHTGKSFSGLNT